MQFYLSSFKIGNYPEKLKEMFNNQSIGYIPNALDFVAEPARQESNARDMQLLSDLDINIEMLDLKEYFNNHDGLQEKLTQLGGVWVRGGNTFILRQAMQLSGFDKLILRITNQHFVYAGYSAGMCVLAPNLKGIAQVDDPTIHPYEQCQETIWEGLELLDFLPLPHFESDHPESADINKEVEFCKAQGISYKTLSDGDIIIIKNDNLEIFQ